MRRENETSCLYSRFSSGSKVIISLNGRLLRQRKSAICIAIKLEKAYQGVTAKGKPAHLYSDSRWCYTEEKPMSVTKKEQQAPQCMHPLPQSSVKLLGTNLQHYPGGSPLEKEQAR